MVTIFDTCRLCLQENVAVVDIYETISMADPGMIICDVLVKYACVQVTWNDGLSSKICNTCKQELHRIARFRIMCELSAIKLQSDNHVKSEGVFVKLEGDTNLDSSNSTDEPMDTCNAMCRTDDVYNSLTVKKEDGTCVKIKNDDEALLHSILDISIEIKEDLERNELKPQDAVNNCEAVTPKGDKAAAPTSPSLYPFECKLCHTSFRWKSQLKSHKKKQRSKCPAFKQSRPSEKSVLPADESSRSHSKADENSRSQCKVVEKPPIDETKAKPTKPKFFPCTMCDKTFTMKHYLQAHERTHTGYRPDEKPSIDIGETKAKPTKPKFFPCTMCDKTFTMKHYLQAHERTHTGYRPYECKLCGKCFTQHSALNTHLALHTGAKPYECEECGKTFALRNYLKQHELVHTSQRQHECPTCGKCYKQKSTLLAHEKICKPD